MTTRPLDQINSVADLKRTATHLGSYFFTASTMRFFSSKVGTKVYRTGDLTGYFVTSERYGEDQPRHYSVRAYTVERSARESDGRECDTLDIYTEAGPFPTNEDAREAAKALAAADKES